MMLKLLAKALPKNIRNPVRNVWRAVKGAPDFNLLRLMADPNKIALDIGANAGDYSRHLVKYAKGVEAYEPVPELAEYIARRNLRVNVHPWALSDHTGVATLRIPLITGGENPANASLEANDNSIGARTREIEVRCFRLDDLDLPPVGLIKMDAEGHEPAILDGATSLIARDGPSILMEADDVRHRTGCIASAQRFFRDRDYTGFFLLGRNLMPIDLFDASQHQRADSLDANGLQLFDRTYVDTFIFVKQPEMVQRLHLISTTGKTL